MEIGTQLLLRHEADSLDGEAPAPKPAQQWPGAHGTLLAVVPIPGTGTSLAIVGYPVSNATLPRQAHDASDGARGPQGQSRPSAGLILDHEQRRVWTDGHEIPLTYQEFELLAFLSAHPATVFSRADLVEQVWQRDFSADSRTVDVHVSRLRHKLGPQYGRYLVTEYRVGYQFRPAASLARAAT
ncbi:MAG: putative two component transcriptional regulator, winged helix family [Actinomycetia bacterium]|nr:putative two component transcriptional regulator, winged helix family [Actinomycetes bacterium]